MTAGIDEELVARLRAMTDDELWDFLRSRLSPASDWTPFLGSEQAERIRSLLVEHIKRVEAERSARNSAMEVMRHEPWPDDLAGQAQRRQALVEAETWRRRSTSFKSLLDRRQAQARRAADEYRRSRHVTDEAARRRTEIYGLMELAKAIDTHRRRCRAEDYIPTDADLELWNALDRVVAPHGDGMRRLSELVRIDPSWRGEGGPA